MVHAGAEPLPARPIVRLGTLWVLRAASSDSDDDDEAERPNMVSGIRIHRGGSGIGVGVIGTGRVHTRVRAPVPTVVVGTPMVQGGLDRAAVQRVLRQRVYQARSCYQVGLRAKPHLAGTMRIRLIIDAAGRVSQSNASGLDATVASCVERNYRYLRFPRPASGGTVQISYLLSFNVSRGGFSPIAPPPPPVPQPHVTPQKPTPIPLIESPVVVHEPDDHGGPAGCHVAEAPDGIDDLVPAAAACYETLLERAPAYVGRVEVEVAVDDAGSIATSQVHGARDDAFGSCLAAAARGLVLSGRAADALRGHRLLVPLSFDKDGGVAPAVTTVSATDHDFRIGLRLLASEVAWSRSTELTRTAWKTVHHQAGDGATVLRIDDGVDAGAVVGALAAYGKDAWKLRFARRAGDDGWTIVSPVASPAVRSPCSGPRTSRVTVFIDKAAIWIGTDKGHVKIDSVGGKHDVLAYARTLRSLRRAELAHRSDLELAVAMPGVPYGVFARVLEIAVESGFHDAVVTTRNAISDPRRRPARSP